MLFFLGFYEKNDIGYLHESYHAKSHSLVKDCDKNDIRIYDNRKPQKASVPYDTIITLLCITVICLYRKNKKLGKENKELMNQILKFQHQDKTNDEEIIPVEAIKKKNDEGAQVEKIIPPAKEIPENTSETTSPKKTEKEIPTFDYETLEEMEKIMEQKLLFLQPDFNIKQLASAMGVTQKKLLATFKQHPQSISFNDYVNQKRVNHACMLLKKHPEYTVEAIAADSGFSSSITFYRWFEKLIGMKPKEYRKKEL